MKTFDSFLQHPDVVLIETKPFLIDNQYRPEETRLIEKLRIDPLTFKKDSTQPDFLVRIRESATSKSLGDYLFFEPGGVYRSQLVREVLLVIQRNRYERREEKKRESMNKTIWNVSTSWYLLVIMSVFFIFCTLSK
jgi:hypothetical protein